MADEADPADVTIAKVDRQCPRCDAKPPQFDLRKEKGKVVAALCHKCNWAF